MQLNFSLKKAWDDLFSNPKYIVQLLIVMTIYILMEFIGTVTPIKGPEFFGSIIIAGYTSLIAYNIINSKEKVLENIFDNPETNKFILLVGLKNALISTIYFAVLLFIPIFYLGFFVGFIHIHIPIELGVILIMLILSPLLFYSTIFPSITFAENLKFIDAFNLKKAFKALKSAWKDYLFCFLIMWLIALVIFLVGFFSFHLVIISQNKSLNINSILFYFSHMNWSFINYKLPQNILFLSIGCFISSYFGTHIVAQVYKRTLIK